MLNSMPWVHSTAVLHLSPGTQPAEAPFPRRCLGDAGFRRVAAEYLVAGYARARAARDGQRTCRGPGPPAHREDVYFRTADFFGGADFFRGAAFEVGGCGQAIFIRDSISHAFPYGVGEVRFPRNHPEVQAFLGRCAKD